MNVYFFKSPLFLVFCHSLLHPILVDTRAIHVPGPVLYTGDKTENRTTCSPFPPEASSLVEARDNQKSTCRSEKYKCVVVRVANTGP